MRGSKVKEQNVFFYSEVFLPNGACALLVNLFAELEQNCLQVFPIVSHGDVLPLNSYGNKRDELVNVGLKTRKL